MRDGFDNQIRRYYACDYHPFSIVQTCLFLSRALMSEYLTQDARLLYSLPNVRMSKTLVNLTPLLFASHISNLHP